nr:glycosyltransferase family 4 protein [Ancylobacter koreensis]
MAVLKIVRRITGGRINLLWSPLAAWLGTLPARRRLAAVDCDYIFVIGCASICKILSEKHRTININDATGKLISSYYPEYDRLLSYFRRNLISFSTESVTESSFCLYPSSWACTSAIHDYGKSPDDVIEIAWGPNLQHELRGRVRELGGELRLLFVGISWHRKGGPKAVEVTRILRERGISARLDVVGYRPTGLRETHDGVTFHGRLKKSNAEEFARLNELYDQAQFFIMPTQFECYGMVFAEAATYGLPIISTRTGGVPSVVKDGETGLLFPVDGSAEEMADAIAELVRDKDRYRRFSENCLADSRDRLNWDVWAKKVKAEMLKRLK